MKFDGEMNPINLLFSTLEIFNRNQEQEECKRILGKREEKRNKN